LVPTESIASLRSAVLRDEAIEFDGERPLDGDRPPPPGLQPKGICTL
jgi:hypothetical protein